MQEESFESDLAKLDEEEARRAATPAVLINVDGGDPGLVRTIE